MPSSTFAGLFKKKKNSSDRFSYNNPNPSNPKKRRLSQFGQFGKSVVGTTYSNPVVLGMHSDYASSQRQSNSMTAFLTTHTASRTTRPHTRPQAPLGLFANLPAPLSSAYNPSTYQSDPLPALPSSSLNPSTQPLPISGPVSDALHNLTLRAVAGQHDRSPGISQVQLLDSILQDNSVINAYAAHCVLQQRASSSTRAGATRAGVDNSFSMSILANLLPPTSTTSPGHHHAVVSLRAHLKTFRDQAHLHNSPLLKTADKIYYFLATVFELPVWDGSKIKRPDRSALVTVEEYRKMVMHLDAGDLSAVKIPNRREEMATKVSTHAMPSPPVLHNAAALSVAEEKVKKWRSPTDRKLDEIKAKRAQEEADTAAAAEAASAAEASPDGFTPEALMRTLTQVSQGTHTSVCERRGGGGVSRRNALLRRRNRERRLAAQARRHETGHADAACKHFGSSCTDASCTDSRWKKTLRASRARTRYLSRTSRQSPLFSRRSLAPFEPLVALSEPLFAHTRTPIQYVPLARALFVPLVHSTVCVSLLFAPLAGRAQ